MKKALKQMLSSVKGALNLTGVVIDVVLLTALIPVVVSFINSAESNLTAIEFTLLSLTTLFIVLALIFNIAKQAGLLKGR